MTTIWALLQSRRQRVPGEPVVTFVAADGARTELSATTLANSAAKTANLFWEEDGEHDLYGVERVALRLPVHWQRSAWLAGLWTAGRAVAPIGVSAEGQAARFDRFEGSEATITTFGDLATERRWYPPIGVVSLHPLGLPGDDVLPAHVFDATIAVRSQPDEYFGPPPRGDDAALVWGTDTVSQAHVVDLAQTKAAAWGLAPGGRLLVGPGTDPLDAWLAALAVPLAATASVVLVDGEHDLDRLAAQERVTATLAR